MPIYDFRCHECGKVSEIFLRHAGQVARCPDCGSDNYGEAYLGTLRVKDRYPHTRHYLLR